MCVYVCVCVCPAVLVNEIPAERMHWFGRGFRLMVASITGSDPIEFGDLGSNVKVTVTWNMSKFVKNADRTDKLSLMESSLSSSF